MTSWPAPDDAGRFAFAEQVAFELDALGWIFHGTETGSPVPLPSVYVALGMLHIIESLTEDLDDDSDD